MIAVDFMKPAKLAVPDGLTNLKRWHDEVSARPSAQGLTMRLTIIGCGDAFGSGGRFNTCFMVEAGGRIVLLDCGASSLVALKARNIDLNTIDGVVLEPSARRPFRRAAVFLLDCAIAQRCARAR